VELKNIHRHILINTLVTALAFAACATVEARPAVSKKKAQVRMIGTAVACPWIFEEGTDTARSSAMTTVEEILQKAGFKVVPRDIAVAAWDKGDYDVSTFSTMPSRADLRTFGRNVAASTLAYGTVEWHTRSIWVNAGPKTISTCTVSVAIMDVSSGRVTYKRSGVAGRSDERSNVWKLAADVLMTPLVTAVSGGPATPQEQRASQIALGLAYRPWVLSQRR
jgi:hypothetical protein